MVLLRFRKAVLDKTVNDLGVSLDQLGDVRVLRGLDDRYTLLCFFEFHLDLTRVPKHLGKQRVAHVNRTDFHHSAVHGRHMFLDLGRDLRVVRFGQGFDAVGPRCHFAADLVVVSEQKVKHVAIRRELRVAALAATALAATTPASPERWSRLGHRLRGHHRYEGDCDPGQRLTP